MREEIIFLSMSSLTLFDQIKDREQKKGTVMNQKKSTISG
jgi:hypothetical protein